MLSVLGKGRLYIMVKNSNIRSTNASLAKEVLQVVKLDCIYSKRILTFLASADISIL